MWVEGCISECSSVSSLGYSCTLFTLLSSLYHDTGWVCIYWIAGCGLYVCGIPDIAIAVFLPPFPCIPEILSPVSYPCVFPLTLELTLIEVNYLSLTILCAPCV